MKKSKKARAEPVFVTHSHKMKKEIDRIVAALGESYKCIRMNPYPKMST